MREPHAIRRLRERCGVEITRGEMERIGQRLALAEYRDNARLFRFIRESRAETQIWQCNLEPFIGREMWVVLVWNKPRRHVATVLAVPADLTAEQAAKWLDKTHDKEAQGSGKRGPNQLPRDRKERRRA